MRRIVLVLAVVGITAAMLMLSAPAFAAGEAHRCAGSAPGDEPPSCPDAHAAEGLGCAAVASGGQTPFGQPALCVHPVNNL
jgi:hypothetical protein